MRIFKKTAPLPTLSLEDELAGLMAILDKEHKIKPELVATTDLGRRIRTDPVLAVQTDSAVAQANDKRLLNLIQDYERIVEERKAYVDQHGDEHAIMLRIERKRDEQRRADQAAYIGELAANIDAMVPHVEALIELSARNKALWQEGRANGRELPGADPWLPPGLLQPHNEADPASCLWGCWLVQMSRYVDSSLIPENHPLHLKAQQARKSGFSGMVEFKFESPTI